MGAISGRVLSYRAQSPLATGREFDFLVVEF